MEKTRINLSTHALVDFVLRKGDIDTRVFNNSSMAEGTRIHLRYQQKQNGDYLSEVPLKGSIEVDDYIIDLEGRADGIIINQRITIIDEIKSTVAPLDEFYESQGEWHLGQAICYAFLYATENNEDEMEIRLTYISQIDTDSKMFKKFIFNIEQLKEKVVSYIKEYLIFYKKHENHIKLRNESAEKLAFPYDDFRSGQRELSKYVYSVCKDGGTLFFEAPTGTGKTISTLYPAIKTFPLNQNEKIFYLSAKNQTKSVAFNAIDRMINNGLEVRCILISSKETMCQNATRNCNPDECIYAKDYYTKLREALNYLIDNKVIHDQKSIILYAKEHEMCPFELQLDYSLLCDIIICDYNYLFDPIVYLKRYFDTRHGPYFALIDEAHNLAERSLDMFSCELIEADFLLLQKHFKRIKKPKFKKCIKMILQYFINIEKDEDYYVFDELDDELIFYLDEYFKASQSILKNDENLVDDLFITCFREVNRFLKISEYYNSSFKVYYQKDNSTIYLRCLDSSNFIKKTVENIRGAVFFSATLTPMEYYIKRLGGNESTPNLKLPSPFEHSHLLLLVRGDISTKYKDRSFSYLQIKESIEAIINQKVGNYLVFFPSYQYMEDVLNIFENKDNFVIQKKEMDIIEKEHFLKHFDLNPNHTTVGFAVLGGSFSEGIDLTSDRLIGAIIVGVGLPGICFERNLIRDYYNENGQDGFDYAYTNPGMNKVLQAAGRVIRTSSDHGVVLLIDNRFLTRKYQDLFKAEWSNYVSVFSTSSISKITNAFWKKI